MDRLIEYIGRVQTYNWWEVAIELVSIGLVVFWIVNFLEGTRGERLFRGVIFILFTGVLLLKLVVGRFGFERLQYLYSGFLIFVLIVTVAAFQPEIRRALIRLGQPHFLVSTSQQLSRTVDEVAKAVKALAADRTGAVIVMERKVALGEFIETGVRLDSRVTSEMLQTIFHPGTALHDMAVVIRGDRIIAASVQLPLAEIGSFDGVELGSRHRAAVGITAGSDAVVIVVSEETGIISVAHNEKLERSVNDSRLREYLSTEDEETATMFDWIRAFRNRAAVKAMKQKVQEQSKA